MTILSTDLVKQFVESTHDETETKEPSRFYGTASVRPDGIYVILDGSTIPTPVSMATDAQTGDRVLVEIVNHQARVIQNINKSNSDIVGDRIEHDETGVFKELRVGKEYVNTLIASDITADSIVADRAKIEGLEANKANITDLDAVKADIETLEAGKANITDLNAVKADIETLETTKLSAEDADIRYLNVDFSKIDKAWLQEFYAQSGIIKDLVIGESTVTGHLVGVTISGDLIEGNTVKADKLVIKGEDGLYYKLNIEGGSTVTEQLTEEMLQNGLDGNNIIANTITAEKISVDDLIAFDATIGGFNIGSNSIYSGVKSSINNTTRGIYLDTDGQVYFGDSTNYLKYYKDTDNTYKLEVSAKSILFGSTGSSVEDTINEIKSDATTAKADAAMAQTAANNAQSSIDNLEIGGRNLLQIGNLGRYRESKVTEDIVNVKVEGYTFTATGDPTDLIGFIVPVESGVITISGKTGLVSQTIYFTVYDSNGNIVQTQRNASITTENGRFVLMLTMPSGASELHIGFGYFPYSSASGDYTVSNLKIEKGNRATDWTPAPEDVDAGIANVQTDINTLSDKTRSGFIEALSGNGFVQSTKTEDGGASEVVVYGKSEQLVTKQSANLCPKYDKWKLSGGAYVDGDYIVFPSSGAKAQVSVHWKKAYNYLWFIISGKSDSNEAVDLYIGCSNGNGWARSLTTDGTTLNGGFGGDGDDYGNKLLNSEYVTFTMSHYGTGTGSMRIRNFMVSKTYIDTSSAYIPFVPDSPSPEYPSEIQSVENPKVTVCGSNLLLDSKGDFILTAKDTGNATDNYNFYRFYVDMTISETYTISADVEITEGTFEQVTVLEYPGGTNAHVQIPENGRISCTFTKSSDTSNSVLLYAGLSGATRGNGVIFRNVKIEHGDISTPYEQYTGKTATLSDIVLRSIPDGTRDKLFKDTDGLWKVERKCGVVDLGTLAWTYNSTYAIFLANVNAYPSFPTAGPNNMGVCSKYLVHGSVVVPELANYDDTIFICPYNWSAAKWLLVRDTSYTDATTFKSAMSGAMLVYELATPTYETLPDSIQTELNALTTYNPITNVMVSDGITPDIDVSFWTRDYYAKISAENAAKVATNFLGYDSINGLIIGNKTSGSWSGYRSQILPGSFNVLDPSSTVLASFGPTTVIGEEAKANLHLTFNNFSMVDKDGTTLFEVGDNRNADGIATIKHTATVTVNSTGSATVTVNSNISSIVSVYADSVQLSSSSYSFSQKDVTINGLTADSQTSIEITYTTTESTVYLTFGERDSSGNIGNYSVAEGYMTTASGYSSHAEGQATTASGLDSHAEGYMTTASGIYSHAEGWKTIASGSYSHAEGWKTIARGLYSHAEGEWTEAIDSNSHAEGYNTTARGHCSHAEGAHTVASGSWSHAGGYMTVADNNYMTAIGQYNTKNSGKAFVIGNGYDDKTRSNAFAVSWAGSVDIAYNIFMELGACYIRDNTFDKTLSVIDGATTLDGLLAQAIINTFSYADAIEILGEEITGRNANINVKKLLQKIVENQRVSYMSIGLSSNKTVSISETWKWVTLPLDSIRGSSGLFASSTISNNCIVIPKDGIYRLSGVFSTKNGAYCSISVNGGHVGVAGIQPQATFASAPIGMTIQRLKSGDMVGLLIEKSSGSNPTVAGANYTHLLVEKIG